MQTYIEITTDNYKRHAPGRNGPISHIIHDKTLSMKTVSDSMVSNIVSISRIIDMVISQIQTSIKIYIVFIVIRQNISAKLSLS